ncbi:MAG: short-chain dehydrogenase [Frankiales bacterium]|nr:short-chain dehydrogenase [Frankiales bacterium]
MTRPLSEQVVVLTGASSGIGRETALRLAARGARVVVTARDVVALDGLSDEIRAAGGEAVAVPADVTDDAAMQSVAAAAVAAHGRIDAWVNNAGVSAYGTVEELTLDDMRRVIEVDLVGTMRGVKVALPHLRAAGGGAIVNVASGLGKRAVPLQAPYCAAKAGVVAFAESLRMELRNDDARIAVVDVLPSSINTPFFRHARSRMHAAPRPMPPTYEPGAVADAIVAVLERPVRSVYVGSAARLLDVAQRVSPALTDRLVGLPAALGQRSRRSKPADDNLDSPADPRSAAAGDWTAFARSSYTRFVGTHPGRGLLIGAAAGALTVRAARRRDR